MGFLLGYILGLTQFVCDPKLRGFKNEVAIVKDKSINSFHSLPSKDKSIMDTLYKKQYSWDGKNRIWLLK